MGAGEDKPLGKILKKVSGLNFHICKTKTEIVHILWDCEKIKGAETQKHIDEYLVLKSTVYLSFHIIISHVVRTLFASRMEF